MSNDYKTWIKHLKGTPDGNALNSMTQDEIKDAFSGNIAFGTGGLRGIMGPGTNRLNFYTVERVTQGLAKTILSKELPKSVCVAYDTRFNSDIFAQAVCRVFSAFGIAVYTFDKPVPTPTLSFAIRQMKLGWGVVITASHNPQEYNGYKVYNNHGVQVTDKTANEITKAIDSVDFFETLPQNNENKNTPIITIGKELEEAYINDIISFATPRHCEEHSDAAIHIPNSKSTFPFIYSALHGAGANAVPAVLKKLGYNPICIQQEPDGAFGGLKTPNPEEPIVYEKAIEAAEKNNAKMLLATDPDCDRVGVLIKTGNGFETLNGNQIGALLIDYLVKTRGVTSGDTVITTIVSGLLGELISKEHGLEFKRLLTGFKYIGEYAEQLPENKRFFFGYEESYGFLAGDGARDKDAVISSALIVKMADYYDQKGMTLLDRWEELSKKHGYCLENLHSIEIPISKQKEIMTTLRCSITTETHTDTPKNPTSKTNNPRLSTFNFQFSTLTTTNLNKTEDFLSGSNELPPSDVIKLIFEDNSWAAIRPSGTEPKIKLYTGVTAKTKEKAKASLQNLTETLLKYFYG